MAAKRILEGGGVVFSRFSVGKDGAMEVESRPAPGASGDEAEGLGRAGLS